jgi:hypothetical protein
MSTIDFSPTAYTVKSPGSGKIMRYESGMYPQMVGAAEREYIQLADEFPNLSRFVVPDHFVQEYCRAYDSNLYSGGGGYGMQGIAHFLMLAERGAGQAQFV